MSKNKKSIIDIINGNNYLLSEYNKNAQSRQKGNVKKYEWADSHPSMKFSPVCGFVVNTNTQRFVDNIRAKKIIQIVKQFDVYKFDPIRITADLNGNDIIVDGQGRAIAAAILGIDTVPCWFSKKPTGLTSSDEDWQAELFLCQDDNNEKVTGWQYHNVAKNLSTPSSRSQKAFNRARDIENMLERINLKNNNKMWKFGYNLDNTNISLTVDLTKCHLYLTRCIFKKEYNSAVDIKNAGSRNCPELEAALEVCAKVLPNSQVVGQNLEIMTRFIRELTLTSTHQSLEKDIKEAQKKLSFLCERFLQNISSKTHEALKEKFGVKNQANKNVADYGVKTLKEEWDKIRKSKVESNNFDLYVF